MAMLRASPSVTDSGTWDLTEHVVIERLEPLPMMAASIVANSGKFDCRNMTVRLTNVLTSEVESCLWLLAASKSICATQAPSFSTHSLSGRSCASRNMEA